MQHSKGAEKCKAETMECGQLCWVPKCRFAEMPGTVESGAGAFTTFKLKPNPKNTDSAATASSKKPLAHGAILLTALKRYYMNQ